jgi:hypothetical protein
MVKKASQFHPSLAWFCWMLSMATPNWAFHYYWSVSLWLILTCSSEMVSIQRFRWANCPSTPKTECLSGSWCLRDGLGRSIDRLGWESRDQDLLCPSLESAWEDPDEWCDGEGAHGWCCLDVPGWSVYAVYPGPSGVGSTRSSAWAAHSQVGQMYSSYVS